MVYVVKFINHNVMDLLQMREFVILMKPNKFVKVFNLVQI